MDIKEASLYIGLQVDTIYRMVSQRRIPFVKVGRRTCLTFDCSMTGWTSTRCSPPLQRWLDGMVA